jgi:hypothetical protein
MRSAAIFLLVLSLTACGGKTSDGPPAATVGPIEEAGLVNADAFAEADRDSPLADASPETGPRCTSVVLQDPVLEQQVREQYRLPDDAIDPGDAANRGWLHADGITSLAGVECFSKLHQVTLSNCPSLDLSPLISLAFLDRLELDGCGADWAPLGQITTLYSLKITNSPQSDMSFAASLTNLNNLEVRNSNVTDISAVAHLQQLSFIALDGSPVSDLTPLAELPLLGHVLVTDTMVRSLAPLDHAPPIGCAIVAASGAPLDASTIEVTLPHMCSLGWYAEWTGADGGMSTCGAPCIQN